MGEVVVDPWGFQTQVLEGWVFGATDVGDKLIPPLIWLVVSNIFYFHPYLGTILILTNIFLLGWNHQLDTVDGWNPAPMV